MRKVFRIWYLCCGFLGLASTGFLFFYGNDGVFTLLCAVFSMTMFNAHDIILIEEKMEKL